jgi:hypothetical protein
VSASFDHKLLRANQAVGALAVLLLASTFVAPRAWDWPLFYAFCGVILVLAGIVVLTKFRSAKIWFAKLMGHTNG